MRYIGMPSAMLMFMRWSFHRELMNTLHFSKREAAQITASAEPQYKSIIKKLPEFEKADIFKMNIVNCAYFRRLFFICPKGRH